MVRWMENWESKICTSTDPGQSANSGRTFFGSATGKTGCGGIISGRRDHPQRCKKLATVLKRAGKAASKTAGVGQLKLCTF